MCRARDHRLELSLIILIVKWSSCGILDSTNSVSISASFTTSDFLVAFRADGGESCMSRSFSPFFLLVKLGGSWLILTIVRAAQIALDTLQPASKLVEAVRNFGNVLNRLLLDRRLDIFLFSSQVILLFLKVIKVSGVWFVHFM